MIPPLFDPVITRGVDGAALGMIRDRIALSIHISKYA